MTETLESQILTVEAVLSAKIASVQAEITALKELDNSQIVSVGPKEALIQEIIDFLCDQRSARSISLDTKAEILLLTLRLLDGCSPS